MAITITKKDAEFYCFEDVALATILGIKENDDYIGERGAKELMKKVSDAFGMPCPKFRFTRKNSRFCYYRSQDHSIHFNYYWGLTTSVVLHEMAHSCHHYFGTGGSIHGPEYVRVWIDIMSRHYDVPAEKFEALANSRGLQYTKHLPSVTTFKPKYG